jgi:hypothetical protein
MGLAVAGKVAAAGIALSALPAGVGGGGGVAFPAAAFAAALRPKQIKNVYIYCVIFVCGTGNYPTLELFHFLFLNK